MTPSNKFTWLGEIWPRVKFLGATLILVSHGLLTFFFFNRERKNPMERHVEAKTAVGAVNAFPRKE